MSASPEIVAAFEAWKLAELAMYYATPCPDEVMDRLGESASDTFATLMVLPAKTAEDGLLKAFPLILREFEPRLGEPPMRPGPARSYNYSPEFLDKLATDLGDASPILRAALGAPLRENEK
jgi:hypothetical protein